MKSKIIVSVILLIVLAIGVLLLINHFWPGTIESILGIPREQHSLTVNVNDEKMGTAKAGATSGAEGDLIALEATPNYGYVFVGWYNGSMLVGSEEKIKFSMPAEDTTITAHFTEDIFTIKMNSMNSAYVDVNSGDYAYLSTITLIANDIEGYTFAGWYVNNMLVSNQNNFEYQITGDAEVYAEYYAESITIISYPVPQPADANTPLNEILLVGGLTDVLGEFVWTNPDQVMIPGYEYMVSFVPVLDILQPLHFMVTIPLKTEVLPAPSISISGGILYWNTVKNAVGYTVKINDELITVDASVLSYELPKDIGEYFVSVKANGDGTTLKDSLYSKEIRYIPTLSTNSEIPMGNEGAVFVDGELVKYSGSYVLDPEAEGLSPESANRYIIFGDNGKTITFRFEIDLLQYISENVKREIFKVNSKTMTFDSKIEIICEIVLHDPTFYTEIDTSFPITIEDLGFGLEFSTVTKSIVDVKIDGEFVDPQLRRQTLNLLFFELTGLDEPIYKWEVKEVPIPGTYGLLSVELAVAFDAVGAIGGELYFNSTEEADYFAYLQLIDDGSPVFDGEFSRTITGTSREFKIEGETDFDINFFRLSTSLLINKRQEEIAVTRLNFDFFNLESDVSGNIHYIDDGSDSKKVTGSDISGAYRFYGQISFEYYLEIAFKFPFLPLDQFSIKVMDGSIILADWDYLKGGIPKQTFKDTAIHSSTPVSATDGEYFYYKDLDGTLRKIKLDSSTGESEILSDIGTAEIVDIDNYYIYVQDGENLRRVGLTGGTVRTVIPGISRVVGSDRTHIYYTEKGSENIIRTYLRMDFEGKARTYLTLPRGWKVINMRYDHSLSSDVIYAEDSYGNSSYYVYDGFGYTQYGANFHNYWYKVSFGNSIVAYYTKDDDGDIVDAFIAYADGGITQDEKVYSISVTPLGIFVTKDNTDENAINPYVIGLYTVVDGHGRYFKLCDVADKYTADRVTHQDGMSYFVDVADNKLNVIKTDGTAAYPIVSPTIKVTAENYDVLDCAILKDKLFVYEHSVGYTKVIYAIDVETLIESPYLQGAQNRVFDKGDPENITYTMGSAHTMSAIYISTLSDAEIEALAKKYNTIKDQYNTVRELLKIETDYFAQIEDAAEKMNKIFEENPGIFSCLTNSASRSTTISKDRLSEFSYGVHSGYVITDAGYIPITINIVDSRTPELITTGTAEFDKNAPMELDYDIKLYDDKLNIAGLKEGTHYELSVKDNGVTTVTFYPSYLLSLPYGLNNITHSIDIDNKISFKVNVYDSRSPQDTEYSKTFDKSNSKNVAFSFNLYDEGYVTSVSGNGIKQNQYSVSDKSLVISEAYLLTRANGSYEFQMTTLEGEVQITVNVIETVAPDVSCDKEYLLGNGTPFTIYYAMNDASGFNIKINNILLKEWEYAYDFSTSTITVFDDFVEYYVPYGNVSISIESYIPSGDDLYITNDYLTTKVWDVRTPVANTDYISYTIQTNPYDIAIRVELYGNPISSLSIDGINTPYHLDQFRENRTIDYRGGYVIISADTIVKKLSVGAHTIKLLIGANEFEIGLYISDKRQPEALDTKINYNVDFPMSAQFAVALYNHEVTSVSGNGVALGDYVIKNYSGDPSIQIISFSAAYLKTLNPEAGDEFKFVVTTDVNEFELTVACYKNITKPGEDNDEPHIPDPVISATAPVVTPEKLYFDLANPTDLTFNVSYGDNNRFGSIQINRKTLKEGKHYEFVDGGFILKAEYLSSFGYGNHTFILNGYLGKSDSFVVNVYDSRTPYLENDVVIGYDRYLGGSKQFEAVMYDSAVKYIICDGVRFNSGFSSGSAIITIFDSVLSTLSIGQHDITIGFDDCDTTISIKVDVNDSGLYFDSVTNIDKSLFMDDITEVFIPWTLYEGRVESVTSDSDSLHIGIYNRNGFMLSGFKSIPYDQYTVRIKANGHYFTKYIRVYDSRKPYLEKSEFVFDKAQYEYSLDPTVTAKYDLKVKVADLYDESIDGTDIFGSQSIYGGDITYEDYDRSGTTYSISYHYLFRLPVGQYSYYIKTTDGNLPFTITIKDSHEPQLMQESPVVYDYLSEEDLKVEIELFGEPLSSLSYVTFQGREFEAIPSDLYEIETNAEGNDILTIKKEFFMRSDIYSNYEYSMRIATTTERTLDFLFTVENGPERPCTVTFISEPLYVYPDGTIEPDISFPTQNLFYGDLMTKPETPTHEYYNFLGFYTEKDGGTLVDFNQPLTTDMFIFPRWEPKTYKINLISDGKVINTLSVKYLDAIPSFSTPTKTGYNFIRWTSDEANNFRFSLQTMPHNDVNVYAEWEIATYKVIFKDMGGAILKTETVTAFENATPPTDEEMYIDEYHIFKGWSGSYTNILSNRILTAVYDIVMFDITYVLDGGTNPAGAPTQYTIDGGVKLKTPTKRGYAFQGWYSEPEFINLVTVIPANLPEGITLYAKWEVGVYGVILDNVYNGEEYSYSYPITNDRVSITYDTDYNLPILTMGNRGYAFMGWYSGRNGTGTQYTDENGKALKNWSDVSIVNLYPYVVDILTITDVSVSNGTLNFKLNQNLSTGVNIKSINLIKYREVIDSISDITGTGTYSFSGIDDQVEYEVIVTFEYDLENNDSTLTTTRSFKIRSASKEADTVVIGQTITEILVKRNEYASYAINKVTVLDATGAEYAAHIYYPASASNSALNSDDGWVYITGLISNAYYRVFIDYTYTLSDYAGTYQAEMMCPVRTNGNIYAVPVPTMNATAVRTHVSTDSSNYYYTYNIQLTPSDVYLENEVRIVRYDIISSDGSIKYSGSCDAYLGGSNNAYTVGVDRANFVDGSVFYFKVYYTYNTQRGDGYVESYTISDQFIADLADPYSSSSGGGCIIDETPVLMADGSYKRAEDVKIGDMLVVWNFQTGSLSVSPVTAIHTAVFDEVIYLKFSDGTVIGISDTHAFYSVDDEKYVNIDAINVERYVGTNFAAIVNGEMSQVCLESYEIVRDTRRAYTIATANGFNHFAENLLCALPFTNVLNLFEFDGMMYDLEALQRDIAMYGLLPYEVASDIITYEQFLALNGPYLSVVIGKGLYTIDELRAIIIDYYDEIIM